eukprot:4192689-Amphidinium_carterae.1
MKRYPIESASNQYATHPQRLADIHKLALQNLWTSPGFLRPLVHNRLISNDIPIRERTTIKSPALPQCFRRNIEQSRRIILLAADLAIQHTSSSAKAGLTIQPPTWIDSTCGQIPIRPRPFLQSKAANGLLESSS